jgi:hypothetical protein
VAFKGGSPPLFIEVILWKILPASRLHQLIQIGLSAVQAGYIIVVAGRTHAQAGPYRWVQVLDTP